MWRGPGLLAEHWLPGDRGPDCPAAPWSSEQLDADANTRPPAFRRSGAGSTGGRHRLALGMGLELENEMAERSMPVGATAPGRDFAEAARRALIDAALGAYEDAGLSGLCTEGRWEAAVDAMRSLDLTHVARQGGGGSTAASAGALAAALTRMVAGLTDGRPKYAPVAAEMRMVAQRAGALAAELTGLAERDAIAFDDLSAAYRLPRGSEDLALARAAAIERSVLPATQVPLEIARAAAAVAELAATVAERGNTNAVADAAVAALISESVCRASALTVRVNVVGWRDVSAGAALRDAAMTFADAAARSAARAVVVVERSVDDSHA